jgi:hypothetical protein
MKESIEETLKERGKTYGSYGRVAAISQEQKRIFRSGARYVDLRSTQRESLDMIANKLARIVNGDPFYSDSWRDIAGYATLIAEELEKDAEF